MDLYPTHLCTSKLGYVHNLPSLIDWYLLRKVQLMIAVNDHFVEPTINAIIKGGRTGPTGEIGDGSATGCGPRRRGGAGG